MVRRNPGPLSFLAAVWAYAGPYRLRTGLCAAATVVRASCGVRVKANGTAVISSESMARNAISSSPRIFCSHRASSVLSPLRDSQRRQRTDQVRQCERHQHVSDDVRATGCTGVLRGVGRGRVALFWPARNASRWRLRSL